MGRAGVNPEVVRRILFASFEDPASFPRMVDREVSRSRKLNSSSRRETSSVLYDAVRWRRRIFGDIPPSHFDPVKFSEALREAKALRAAPPLAHYAELPPDVLARELSFPTWLIERWTEDLGLASAVELALGLNEPAPVTFRANLLKTDRAALRKKLSQEGIHTEEGDHSPWALHLGGRENIRSIGAFKQGLFEVQDEGSQVSVLLSDARPGEFAIDACARTGGKALALAAMMENKGRILALDADARPLELLKKRAKRNGAKIIETSWVAPDDPSPLPQFREKADLVFIDAPCSGFGTLRRQPWMKWAASSAAAEGFPAKQFKLLKRYAAWVKPGGRLLYAVCTIHSKENEIVASRFLAEEPSFSVKFMRTLRPDMEGTDGFFIASFQRIS